MNWGVTTSVWGTYGKYLPDWVDSIADQELVPDVVTIVDAGADDLGPARAALEEVDLPWQIVKADSYRYGTMGEVRNRGVDATKTAWVTHLDADDTFLPHALSDADRIGRRAHVVSMGAIRDGRTILFPGVSRRSILMGNHGALSPSPFRRYLWEKRPYLTRNDWIESALWVGFAHLGARFAPTRRPGFVYRTHVDSHSATLTPQEKAEARRQLTQLRRRWTV